MVNNYIMLVQLCVIISGILSLRACNVTDCFIDAWTFTYY